ncbi:MAG: hypothetical protein JW776_00875 [Candidatus Lokiarchaeota archaeon]|nr:hypothetical protein [Candidatus Lokiarchaeota archaeon]
MKTLFLLIVYSPLPNQQNSILSHLMLKNVIHELVNSPSFSIYNNTITILSDAKYKIELKEVLGYFTKDVQFRFLEENNDDLTILNHHINTHIQRALVSSNVNYCMVISSALPIFSNLIFKEEVKWDSDIIMGLTESSDTSMLIFQKQFTPFFFKLPDESIKTSERNLALFKQYKRSVNIIKNHIFLRQDSEQLFLSSFVIDQLKREGNIYQSELYRLLLNMHES